MKKFFLISKIVILVGFFFIANITSLTELNLAGANAIAGVLFVFALFAFVLEWFVKEKKP